MAMSQDVKVALVLATFGLLVLFGLKYSSGKYEPVKPPDKARVQKEEPTGQPAGDEGEDVLNLAWKGEWPVLDEAVGPLPENQDLPAVSASGKKSSPEVIRYTVQAGDTFASISKKFYGTKSKWRIIFDANKEQASAPEKLRAGTVLVIPPLEKSAALSLDQALEVPGTYVVQPGDTLSSIATKLYGSPTKWRKIYEANSEILPDPSTLRVGQRLRIPE